MRKYEMLPQNRVCFSCKEDKPITDYYKSNVRYYQRECKICTKNRKNVWYKTTAGKQSSTNTKLKSRFGISLEEYNILLKRQENKCCICGASESYLGHKLAVDHNHSTGEIRGLLCKACNLGIGNFKDSIDSLEKAILYLKGTNK